MDNERMPLMELHARDSQEIIQDNVRAVANRGQLKIDYLPKQVYDLGSHFKNYISVCH